MSIARRLDSPCCRDNQLGVRPRECVIRYRAYGILVPGSTKSYCCCAVVVTCIPPCFTTPSGFGYENLAVVNEEGWFGDGADCTRAPQEVREDWVCGSVASGKARRWCFRSARRHS